MIRRYLVICLILFGAVLASAATPETFKGEDELLSKLPPRDLAVYLELRILMNPLQMRQYLTLGTEAERSAWVKHFWVDQDPTPTTDVNERKIEHEKRVLLARKYYPSPKIPGWDDRGEAIIRWGFPSYKARIMGAVDLKGVVAPREIWYYDKYNMLLNFQDLTLTENYTYTSGAMSRTWSSLDEIRQAQLRREQEGKHEEDGQNPTETLAPQDLKNVLNNTDPNEIDYWNDRFLMSQAANMKDLINVTENERIASAEGRFEKFLEDHPVIHQCDLDQNTLPLYFDVARFKGAGGALRTEVSFEVPAKDIAFVPREGETDAEVEFRVLVRDYGRNKVASGVDSFIAVARGDLSSVPTLLPGQVVLSLEPGSYVVGLEAYDKNSKRRAGLTATVQLAPFGPSLAVSDIQFASGIRESEATRKFVKGGLWVVPHPQRGFRKGIPMNFYFEIYGLDTDKEGTTFYRVEYKIVPLGRKRWGPVLIEVPETVSSAFETSGTGSTQPQRLTIATDELWEGRFRLEVTVTDRRTFATAAQQAEFSILK